MLRQLSIIPLPIRILTIVLVGVVMAGLFRGGLSGLSGDFSGVAGIATLIAILLWIIVIAAVMYEMGWLNFLSTVPLVSSFFGFLTNRAAMAAARADVSDSGPRAKLSAQDRRKLEADAKSALNGLIGIEEPRQQIEQRLLGPAVADAENPFGTQAPAVVAVFCGPRGVGMTTAAVASGQILAARGALEIGHVVTVREIDLRSGVHGTASSLATTMAQRAVGGTLLLENAGWLTAADPYGGPGPGADFGIALLDVVQRYPKQIFVAMTLSDEEGERLTRQPDMARWLGKLTVRTIAFDNLDDEALLEVLEMHLEAAGWSLADDAAQTMARRMIADLCERAGDGFDNAEACRRAAEVLIEIARSEGTEKMVRERLIDRQIIGLADEQLE